MRPPPAQRTADAAHDARVSGRPDVRPTGVALRRDFLALLGEAVIVVLGYAAYSVVRGFTEGDTARALANADAVVNFEQALRIFWEPAWQRAIIDDPALVDLANIVYIWGHWPVIIPTAIWLFFARRSTYYVYRTAFLLSGAIGLVVFAAYPLAPPRLADLGMVDTIVQYSESYRVFQPPALVNQYAAMPSLHFGWHLLVASALIRFAPWLVVRVFAIILPCAMFFAIVVTANHFIIDAVAGIAVCFGALWLTARLARTRRDGPLWTLLFGERREPAPGPR